VIRYRFDAEQSYDELTFESEIKISWDRIFFVLSPILLNEASDDELRAALNDQLEEWTEVPKGYLAVSDFNILEEDFNTIRIQLRALGLITRSERQRSIRDTATHWTLTSYGDTVMTQLRAITKKDSAQKNAPKGSRQRPLVAE
jgi:hypothetical protein